MSKIITNYRVINNEQELDNKSILIPSIIKNDKIQEQPVIINPDVEQEKLSEPRVSLQKNKEGIVTVIDILCVCGEKITIKLDYQ